MTAFREEERAVGRLAGMRLGAWAGAAALALAGAANARAQQAPPAAAAAQPAVGLGVGIEEDPAGPRVAAVVPGGTAAGIGMRTGDILVQVGGKPIDRPEVITEYVRSLK